MCWDVWYSRSMVKKILLDGKAFRFGEGDLPCLVHGKDGMGASLFTVSLMAGLHKRGFKLVFLSGYPMARDELVVEVLDEEEFKVEVKRKLVEEASEVLEAESGGVLSELADVLEMVMAVAEVSGLSMEELEMERVRKLEEKGGFEKRLILVGRNGKRFD